MSSVVDPWEDQRGQGDRKGVGKGLCGAPHP